VDYVSFVNDTLEYIDAERLHALVTGYIFFIMIL
jgi:hypothetical protein